MGFLLDTSALSEALKRQPREPFMARLRKTPADELFTSAVCVMELRYGCALRGNEELWGKIQQNVLSFVTALPFGNDEAVRCGQLLAELAQKGRPIGIEDTQIGATALVHDLAVITFNTKHFEAVPNLQVDSWLS